jgi:hypothetical protein
LFSREEGGSVSSSSRLCLGITMMQLSENTSV